MKLTHELISQTLNERVQEGDHLISDARALYKKLRSKAKIRGAADYNRKYYAKEGYYLKAVIHDQIYRLAGGVD